MAIADYRAKLDQLKAVITQFNNGVLQLFRDARDRINNHTQAKGNVHGLEPKHLGLENVPNWPPATKDQAIAGTNSGSVMSPRRVNDYADANVITPIRDAFQDAADRL